VSEALLYRHFANKAALYDCVLECCIHRSLDDAERIRALPDSTGTLVLAVYAVVRSILCPPQDDGSEQDVPRLLLQSLLGDGCFAKDFIQLVSSPWVDKISGCIRAAIAAGDIDATEEEAIMGCWFAHHLASALVFHQLPERVVVQLPSMDREVVFERSVRFVLRGLGLYPEALRRHYHPEALALLSRGA
jgi:AcrR family transcriptional regulator